MKMIKLIARVLLVFAASVALAYASDFTAFYARVDKVILESNPDSPETIQVFGVFSMAKPNDRNDYLPAARGYLYFRLAYNPGAARKEWVDLKDVAGTGQIVAFGNRHDRPPARLRKADEQPENPDPYSMSIGLQRVSGRTDYPPIRALLDYKD
jgi:hypothetical protein